MEYLDEKEEIVYYLTVLGDAVKYSKPLQEMSNEYKSLTAFCILTLNLPKLKYDKY